MSKQKVYYGKDIEVMFDSEVCTHSGNCVKGLPGVFDVNKRPWVEPDAETAEAIARQIDKCPSGALTYKRLLIVEHDTANKMFLIRDNGTVAAEMTYVISSPELYIIDHTFVENAYRGQGLGDKLVNEIVNYARENGIKIMPLCPFAKAQFERHSEYADVLNK